MEALDDSSSNVQGDYVENNEDQLNLDKQQGDIIVLDDNDDSRAQNEQMIVPDEGDIRDLSGCLIGLKRNTVEDLYDAYCKHASEVGFSVRKSNSYYNVKKVIVQKWFVCSCEGTRKDVSSSSSKTTYLTRTDCKASLRVKLNVEGGFYEVFHHTIEHNHALSRKEWSYMHRSQRSISNEKAIVIEDMISSGIRAVDSYRYMVHDAGGEHILGHTKRDHLNFVHKLKIDAIEGGDAQTLIDSLYQQVAEDQDFFLESN